MSVSRRLISDEFVLIVDYDKFSPSAMLEQTGCNWPGYGHIGQLRTGVFETNVKLVIPYKAGDQFAWLEFSELQQRLKEVGEPLGSAGVEAFMGSFACADSGGPIYFTGSLWAGYASVGRFGMVSRVQIGEARSPHPNWWAHKFHYMHEGLFYSKHRYAVITKEVPWE